MKKLFIVTTLMFMLAAQTVFGAETSDWAKEDYQAANERGLIPLSIAVNNLKDNITRVEFCSLAVNMFDSMYHGDVQLFECPFTDCNEDFVVKAYSLGIVSGKSPTEFYPFDTITRQEMAKILVNTLEIAGKELPVSDIKSEKAYSYADFAEVDGWAAESFAKVIKYGIMSGFSESELKPHENATREQAVAIVSRSEAKFQPDAAVYTKPTIVNMSDGDDVSGDLSVSWDKTSENEYIVIVKDEDYNCIDISASVINKAGISTENFDVGKKYTITVAVSETYPKAIYSDPVEVRYNQEEKKFEVLSTRGEKYKRVFPNGEPFKSKAEADPYMVNVEVPVWHLKSDGSKTPSKATLTVNVNLADDVLQIFTEIFENGEQFPIKNVGGYTWRNSAVGRLSEHSYGTCIDINWDENYYCYANTGVAITGSFWKPYENPYSIPENGSVVQTFAKYGWAWGGNAWSRLRDYMHFTYLGN